MSEEKVKIVIVGPSKSGKTTMANFLCGTRETPTTHYYETNPLRIVETDLELQATNLSDRRVVFSGGDAKKKRVMVQLWDLGGSAKHQAGWPAVARHADGLIYLFNPEVKDSQKELALWHKNFAMDQNTLDDQGNFAQRVADKHALVFAHHSTAPTGGTFTKPVMPKGLEKVKVIETSLDFQSENFKDAFDKLVEQIVVDRMDAEENDLLQQQREEESRPQLRV